MPRRSGVRLTKAGGDMRIGRLSIEWKRGLTKEEALRKLSAMARDPSHPHQHLALMFLLKHADPSFRNNP